MASDPVFDNGFFLKDVTRGYSGNLAAYSLQSALESFTKTADDLDYLYNYMNASFDKSQEKEDEYHGTDYAVDACNAIVQFQHFVELFLKDILLEVNQLMVYDAATRPVLLYKMAIGATISDSELEDVHFIEFSDALKRVRKLQSEGILNPKYGFLSQYYDAFEKINKLRNRIAHRGVFILRHEALDEIFGKFILPFVKDLSATIDKYKNCLTWRSNIKDNAISPIEAIIDEFKKLKPNDLVVYAYKLIASAGFNNKLNYGIASYFKDYLDAQIRDAEEIANILATKEMFDVKVCPICGCKTLIEHIENDFEEDGEGEVIKRWTYVYEVNCQQCGFHLNHWLLGRLKGLGLPIPDYYWQEVT